MKTLKKLGRSFFWLLLNLLALYACIKFLSEDITREIPHNVWLSFLAFVAGITIVDLSVKILIENYFEKVKKPNRFKKRMFILLTTILLNMVAATLIVLAVGSAFKIPADLFFAKILVGIFMIFDIWKLKKILERIRKNRSTKHLLPYG